MKEIKALINDRIDKFSKSGKFTEQIDKQIEAMFKDLMRDIFSTWGEPVKQLKQSILEQLQLNNLKLDIPSYNAMVVNIVKEQMGGMQVQHIKERAAEMMKELFNPLGKNHWTLSEIIEEYKKTLYDSGEIKLIVDWSEGLTSGGSEFCHIYFDECSRTSKYSCKYQLNARGHKDADGKMVFEVFGGVIAGNQVKDIKAPPLYNFDAFMFQLLAEGVTIDIDEDYVDKEWNEYGGED